MAVILALVSAMAAVTCLPRFGSAAFAHVCTNPAEVSVGQVVNINFGVAAEEQPVSVVDVTVPDGFALREAVGFNGWTAERSGRVVRFRGATLQPYSCGFFTLVGSATRRGVLRADITVQNADGSQRRYTDADPYSPFPALGIYADVEVPAPSSGGDGGAGLAPIVLALSVAAVAGGGVALVMVSRSRRRLGR